METLIAAPSRPRSWKWLKSALLGTALIAAGVALYRIPPELWLDYGQRFKTYLASFGVWAPEVFLASTAGLIAFGFPRLPLCAVSAMSFGFEWGLTYSLCASLVGSYGMFVFVRCSGADFGIHRNPALHAYAEKLATRGLLTVLLIRQLPVNGLYNNVLLGLSRIKHRDFWLGSAIGFLPTNIAACLAGAGLLAGDPVRATQYVVLGCLVFTAAGWGLHGLTKQLQRKGRHGRTGLEATGSKPTRQPAKTHD